jgi:hypothetical protein
MGNRKSSISGSDGVQCVSQTRHEAADRHFYDAIEYDHPVQSLRCAATRIQSLAELIPIGIEGLFGLIKKAAGVKRFYNRKNILFCL